ncbi:MAG TPA: nucleotide exchange factor GrpE [Rudaea sp.]|jgi:molecular chaperone GrpE|uniref:nucleotide exchange factor GrpE n=1 Tax=Rudaea sp. TaxID=2136325 RepID=UPI002F929741
MENTNPTNPAGSSGADPANAANEEALNADSVQTETDQLGDKLAEYENKLGEMREVLLRERAEIENQRKRLQRDLEQARKFANERLLGDLLPVCDSLERGLAVENADTGALREGMDLTLKALLKVAENNGLKPIDPLGQPFDPERHQAMSMIDAPGKAPNTVVAVMQKGYVLNDRLLRPALVAIAKPPAT